MKRHLFFQLTLGFILLITSGSIQATGSTCKTVISKQEEQKGIPQDLLKAIAVVESGISPWAVNAQGRAHIFKSKEAAARYIRELVEEGVGNIGVGCMQLHYASHRRHFKSVEEMLEPEKNIAHAAKLIKNLQHRHGSIDRAVQMYHSASPAHHKPYKNRVYGIWAKIRRSKPKDTALKPASLEVPAQKIVTKTPKSPPKIKFGVGGQGSRKS